MSMTVEKSFLTTRQAAQILGVSLKTIQIWAESGSLRFWKTGGGHRRILRESVESVLARRQNQEPGFRATAMSGQLESLREQPSGRFEILVVEDEPTLLRLYRMALARWAMQPRVTTASNGFEGLVRIGNKRPDLLITDLEMPEMDGFQMLRTLRSMPEMDRMEMVVVTGLDPGDILARGGLPEGIPVLYKPIPFTELEEIAVKLSAEREAPWLPCPPNIQTALGNPRAS